MKSLRGGFSVIGVLQGRRGFLPQNKERKAAAGMAGTPDSTIAEPQAGPESGKVGSPASVDVICGTLRGKFLVETWRVIVDGAL